MHEERKMKPHSVNTAPEGAKEILQAAEKSLGFVPNLYGVMAEAPALLKAYTTVSRIFGESSLSAAEQQTVLLTVSRLNGCEYCVAAHSALAGMQKVPEAVIGALRSGTPIADDRLEAVRQFTEEVVEKRGWPSTDAVNAFRHAGYAEQQMLEVILGVGMKILSNYTNHIAKTQLDAAFVPAKWSRQA